MWKRGWMTIVLAAALGAAVMVSGCGRKEAAKKSANHSKKSAARDEATAGKAINAQKQTGNYTFDALCGKLTEQMRAANVPARALDRMVKDCGMAEKLYIGQNKAGEVFVRHILTACESKNGMDWLQCYSSEGAAASRAAAEKIK